MLEVGNLSELCVRTPIYSLSREEEAASANVGLAIPISNYEDGYFEYERGWSDSILGALSLLSVPLTKGSLSFSC